MRSICYREGKTVGRGVGHLPGVMVEPSTTLEQGGRTVRWVEHHSSSHTSAQLSKLCFISTCRPQAGHCGLSSDWHHGPPCLVVLIVYPIPLHPPPCPPATHTHPSHVCPTPALTGLLLKPRMLPEPHSTSLLAAAHSWQLGAGGSLCSSLSGPVCLSSSNSLHVDISPRSRTSRAECASFPQAPHCLPSANVPISGAALPPLTRATHAPTWSCL